MRSIHVSLAVPAAMLAFLFPAFLGGGVARAQDLEPRRWTHLPVGTNILGVAYAYTLGEIRFDPALRIRDAEFDLHTAVLAYNRYFDLLGRTARVDVQLPLQSGEWNGLLDGERASVSRSGLGDPRFRFSLNVVGPPAMDPKSFLEHVRTTEVSTTVGTAIAVRVPLGEYMEDKLINLGKNRYSIRPQIGVLHTRGTWSFELTGSTFFYTDNGDFFGDLRLEQSPLFGVQTHVVKSFGRGLWVSGGVGYGWGGATEIDGAKNDDERSDLLYGLSFGCPVSRAQSLRLGYIRRDTFAETGTESHNWTLSWIVRF